MDKFINDYRQMVGQHVTYNHGENSMLAIGRYLKKKHLVESCTIRIPPIPENICCFSANLPGFPRGQPICLGCSVLPLCPVHAQQS
mgnify:CR=1 FL=1